VWVFEKKGGGLGKKTLSVHAGESGEERFKSITSCVREEGGGVFRSSKEGGGEKELKARKYVQQTKESNLLPEGEGGDRIHFKTSKKR